MLVLHNALSYRRGKWIYMFIVVFVPPIYRFPVCAAEGSACHGVETKTDDSFGTITSPNYPGDYPKNSDCTWQIISTNGEAIALTIQDINNKEFSVTSSDGHCYDKLKIYQLVQGRRKTIDRDVCGNSVEDLERAQYFISSTAPEPNIVILHFTSDYVTQYSGFSITFRLDHVSSTALAYDEPVTTATATTIISAPTATTTTTTATTIRTSEKADKTTQQITRGVSSTKDLETIHLPTDAGLSSNDSTARVLRADQNYGSSQAINSPIFIVLTVVFGLLFIAAIVILLIAKRNKKQSSTSHPDVIFQNLTHDSGVDGDMDEYGRPRENTYVEIPLIPPDDDGSICKGRLSTTLCRKESNNSIDSIAREKFEAALASKPARKESTSLSPTQFQETKADQAYHMAGDDCETPEDSKSAIYLRPSSVSAAPPTSPTFDIGNPFQETSGISKNVYAMADDESNGKTERYRSKPTSLEDHESLPSSDRITASNGEKSTSVLPEGIYNVPSSPPCDPPGFQESFYDHPKRPSVALSSKPPSKNSNNNQQSHSSPVPTESNYCTMTGNLNQKPSPSQSFSSGNVNFDKIPQDSSLYVDMMSPS